MTFSTLKHVWIPIAPYESHEITMTSAAAKPPGPTPDVVVAGGYDAQLAPLSPQSQVHGCDPCGFHTGDWWFTGFSYSLIGMVMGLYWDNLMGIPSGKLLTWKLTSCLSSGELLPFTVDFPIKDCVFPQFRIPFGKLLPSGKRST